MSEAPDIHKLILHDPIRPFPLSLLARQLEFIFLGIPTTTIFCFDGDLVDHIDPSHPPQGIVPNSRQAFLLDRFLKVRTRHRCTVKAVDPETGLKKRCNKGCFGYIEILKHQREVHQKTRHYTCIVEECMAVFDRIGNAKRHAERVHNADSLRSRQAVHAQRRSEMQHRIKAAKKRADKRRERREAARKKLVQHGGVKRTLKFPKKTKEPEIKPKLFLRLRLRPPVLDIRSVIRKDPFNKKICIDILPTGLTRLDVERFHTKGIEHDLFQGVYERKVRLEWVGVTGLLDLFYGKGNMQYTFLKEPLIPIRVRLIPPAPPIPEDSDSM